VADGLVGQVVNLLHFKENILMNTLKYKSHYRRKLPHYQPIWAKLFITYRLADSLPDHVVAKLRQEQVQKEKELARIKDINERKHLQYEFQRRWFAKYDAYLDRAETGPKWLIDPGIAKLVYESIRYRDGKVYDLDCLTIMSNHVHPGDRATGCRCRTSWQLV
jgi:putative transposase